MGFEDHPAMGPRTMYIDCVDCGEEIHIKKRRTWSYTTDYGSIKVESLCPSCHDQRVDDDPAGPPPGHPARK